MPERLIGETLGRYRVEALVGSGGFAWVYRAFDPELEIFVALKVLKPQYAGDADFEARFRREASTAAKLRHPNIVSIFAVGKENGAVYFAMDYLPRGLADRLEAVPCLPQATVVRAGLDVAKALAFAHREGVVHRDIKVDNILFDDHGNAVVADFGIARAVTTQVRDTATNMVVGTPQYFSPEQARGQELDGRSDIYSLGVTLFRAATGRLPFDGDDWYSIARQHVEDPPPLPRSLNPALTPEFEQIILRCLGKKPQDRFATADELVERLEALRHPTMEVTAARTVVMEPFREDSASRARRRWGRLLADRRRLLLAGVSALAITSIGAAVLSARGRNDGGTELGAAVGGPGLAERPASVPPISTELRPMDSIRLTKARSESLAAALPPPPPKQTLRVNAPRGTQIEINGRLVGQGQWSSDTLGVGRYTVVGILASAPPGCPSRRHEVPVVLAANSRRNVSLTPRPCGTVDIVARMPKGLSASYQLTPLGPNSADAPMSGPLPTSTLVVPTGRWRVRLELPAGCSPFSDELQVTEQPPVKVVATVLCGTG